MTRNDLELTLVLGAALVLMLGVIVALVWGSTQSRVCLEYGPPTTTFMPITVGKTIILQPITTTPCRRYRDEGAP